jgi:hypothetical protein
MQAEKPWQGSGENKYMFCFNPACPSPSSRMFVLNDMHQYHISTCSKWFLDSNAYSHLTNPKKMQVHPMKEEVLLFTAPLQGMIKFYECK